MEEIKKYDESGNLVYRKDSSGFEYWYDSNHNLLHYKNSSGDEWWYEYDKRGNMIHHKDSNGYEFWKEYDSKNRLVHHKDSKGYDFRKKYDLGGNSAVIEPKGVRCETNSLIHCENSDKTEYQCSYDSKNNEVHRKYSDGFEIWREFDENSNCVHYRDSNGKEFWNKFDSNNNIIHHKEASGFEFKYDEDSNALYCKNPKEVDQIDLTIDLKNSHESETKMTEVYFFFQKWVNGEIEQSPYYDSLKGAMKARKTALNSSSFENVSPVMKGYIEENFIYGI